MATIKSFTSLEQSRKLAEMLPLESADMFWANAPITVPCIKDGNPMGVNIPCWSLAALLCVLPKGTNISIPDPFNKIRYSCWNDYDITYASNPIDACYEMIIRLNELKML